MLGTRVSEGRMWLIVVNTRIWRLHSITNFDGRAIQSKRLWYCVRKSRDVDGAFSLLLIQCSTDQQSVAHTKNLHIFATGTSFGVKFTNKSTKFEILRRSWPSTNPTKRHQNCWGVFGRLGSVYASNNQNETLSFGNEPQNINCFLAVPSTKAQMQISSLNSTKIHSKLFWIFVSENQTQRQILTSVFFASASGNYATEHVS